MKEKTVIAMVGGGAREASAAGSLFERGYAVRTFALPAELLPAGPCLCRSMEEALAGAEALLLPLRGVLDHGEMAEGICLRQDHLELLPPGAPVLTGLASAYLCELCRSAARSLIAVADMDEFACPNAALTAEGAIWTAIGETPFALAGTECLLIGYGRVGAALAARLRAFSVRVRVSNRGDLRTRQAALAGFTCVPWAELPQAAAQAALIFNTVPALVLDREILSGLRPGTVIIDLAQKPGGVDHAAAEALGLKAVLASGLPGKTAPQTAGRILAASYDRLLQENLRKDAPGRAAQTRRC